MKKRDKGSKKNLIIEEIFYIFMFIYGSLFLMAFTLSAFKNGFIFSKQLAPAFKKWIIKCYNLGDVIITPTPYSKKLLHG